jgi:hypothetical protein
MKYIPLDKSWIIRMGVLDILNRYEDIIKFLEYKELNDDLQAMLRAAKSWHVEKEIDVGESATLYRFLKFASWKLNLNKKFILRGTLAKRRVCDNPEIINYSQKELLKLDNGTSQWASAAVLLGDNERIDNPPYKLQVTYDAVEHWNRRRVKGVCWEPRFDATIANQAQAFLDIVRTDKTDWKPEQAEGYCFARAFGLITKEEGEKRWPSLRGHESDRVTEMENAIEQLNNDEEITSKDHRVVQATAMLAKIEEKKIKIKYPESVNKSWPLFWEFLENSKYVPIF